MQADPAHVPLATPAIVGRSSSHFTRVTRIFAHELAIAYDFEAVADLTSLDPHDYADNPALKIPALRTSEGVWYGSLNVCRELARRSRAGKRILWPEDLVQPLPANAQELVTQAMATEVALIMAKMSGNQPQAKPTTSLENTLSWLEGNVEDVIAALPADRNLSFLEVALFCLVTHLDFRGVLPTAPYVSLNSFCERFGTRASASDTPYRFDS